MKLRLSKKYYLDVSTFIWFVFCTIAILFMAWFMVSYAEVLLKNLGHDPEYSKFNFFKVFFM